MKAIQALADQHGIVTVDLQQLRGLKTWSVALATAEGEELAYAEEATIERVLAAAARQVKAKAA